jgi:redox-sensitive bicupin YhaK (pirin superfamily)
MSNDLITQLRKCSQCSSTYTYIPKGEAIFGPAEKQKTAKTGQMTDDSTTATSRSTLDVLLIGGVPLNEPVARYGPFVMNTKEEILKAREDYRTALWEI